MKYTSPVLFKMVRFWSLCKLYCTIYEHTYNLYVSNKAIETIQRCIAEHSISWNTSKAVRNLQKQITNPKNNLKSFRI